MQPFPHVYRASARGSEDGAVPVTAEGAPEIDTFPPVHFDGPPNQWSPEGLLLAAVADCYVLSFRAVARASKLRWDSLDVIVEGVLERIEGVTRFSRLTIAPKLALAEGQSETLAGTVMERSKRACLVTNSLTAECVLQPQLAQVAPT